MAEITSLSQLDMNGTYSYADYLTWKFEEYVEIIKGKIMPMAAPNTRHQRISGRLNGMFYVAFSKHPCEFFAAPFDVRLYDKRKSEKANKDIFTVVQPDLCIICDASKLDTAGCLGAPDLVVEILSPGNSKKELRTKKLLYEESGIREYWIFDPIHENVYQFCLTDAGVYGPPALFINEDTLPCWIFPELKIDLADLFAQK